MGFPTTATPVKYYPTAADGTSIASPSGGSAWTNTVYVEIIGSTPTAWLLTGVVVAPAVNSGRDEWEIDLATGAASSETVIATLRGVDPSSFSAFPAVHPLRPALDVVPAGTRLAARLRRSSTTASGTWRVSLQYYEKPFDLLDTTTLAPKWAPSAANGVTLTTVDDTWGNSAWAEVVASTAGAWTVNAIFARVTAANVFINGHVEIDVGVGSVGSEVVVATHRLAIIATGEWRSASTPWLFGLPIIGLIPAGSRVSVRIRGDGSRTLGQQTLLVSVGYHEGGFDGTEVATAKQQAHPAAATGPSITTAITVGSTWADSPYTTIGADMADGDLITGLVLGTTEDQTGFVVSHYIVELATGAVGSEAVIARVRGRRMTIGAQAHRLWPPVRVPAAGRISARLRADPIDPVSGANETPITGIGALTYYAAGSYDAGVPFSTTAAYDPDPGFSENLIALTPPNKTWGNSAWVEAVAYAGARSVTLHGISGTLQQQLSVDAADVRYIEYEIDIGTGASGAETVIGTLRVAGTNDVVAVSVPPHIYFPVALAVSSVERLAVRIRMGTTAVDDFPSFDVALLLGGPTCTCAPRTEYGGGVGYTACCGPIVEGVSPFAPTPWDETCDGAGSGGPDGINATDAENWAQ